MAAWNLRKLTRYMLVIGVIMAVVVAWAWYTQLYLNKERRFWMAIENSMATPSVIRTLTDGGTGNQVVQSYRFHFAPQRVIENRVEFTQKSSTADTHVVTEGIIFPESQFLRYTDFINRSNDAELANIDKLLGKWASQEAGAADQAQLNYLGEYVTLVIFGNFSPDKRADFVTRLRDNGVYSGDFFAAREEKRDDEAILNYDLSVNLREYVRILNDSFIAAGYGDFPPLNPENYREGAKINVSIQIRKQDNTIIGVGFGGRDERYSNYGVMKTVEAPEASLTIEELQEQVQELIQ